MHHIYYKFIVWSHVTKTSKSGIWRNKFMKIYFFNGLANDKIYKYSYNQDNV